MSSARTGRARVTPYQIYSKTFSLDAILEATETNEFSINAILEASNTKEFTADSFLVDRLTKEYTINAIIEATETKTFSIGGILEQSYIKGVTLPSYSITITDTDDVDHTIIDNVQHLLVNTALSSAADTFDFIILNNADEYSYIEQGCEISISTGYDDCNAVVLVGVITNVNKTLDHEQIKPIMEVSGEDWGHKLNKMYFPGRFFTTEISAIVKGIFDKLDYTTGQTYRDLMGVSSNYTYIDSTLYTIGVATFNWKSVSSAVNDLAEEIGYEWYIDTSKRLHFFDPAEYSVKTTITDSNLVGSPIISDHLNMISRSVVIGGYEHIEDQAGVTETTTTTVTDSVAKNESFVPAEEYLSAVFVHTELVADSVSNITISIQDDATGSPTGVFLPNAYLLVPKVSITDDGYTEFKFNSHVTLTPGNTYWMVIKGTTSDGVKLGVDGSADLDFNTRHPVRVAVMYNDNDLQKRGMYVDVFRDEKIEDTETAELKAQQMIGKTQKKTAEIAVYGNNIVAGEVVRLTITEPGVAIDKDMKVINSSQSFSDVFIVNRLNLVEV